MELNNVMNTIISSSIKQGLLMGLVHAAGLAALDYYTTGAFVLWKFLCYVVFIGATWSYMTWLNLKKQAEMKEQQTTGTRYQIKKQDSGH